MSGPDVAVNLPAGWSRSKLADVASVVKDKVDPLTVPGTPYVGLEHVESRTMRVLDVGTGADVKSAKTRFSAGDVLYGRLRPYLNKVARPDFDGICSTDFLVITESDALDAGYVAYFLNQSSVAAYADHVSAGVQLPRVAWKALGNYEIAYPVSKQEQRRIVSLIDQVRDGTARASENLALARVELGRFRASVLAAAFSGRLTSDVSLMTREAEGSRDEEGESALPPSWRYARLDSLREPQTPIAYGIVLPGPHVDGGVPYVRQQDVVDGTVRVDSLGRTTPEIAEKHRRSELRAGDVLLCIIRNLRVAVVPPGLDGANITQGMVRIRPNEDTLAEYLALYLESPQAQSWMHDRYIGLAMPRINVADARDIPVPLPPLPEQRLIVERVAALLSAADAVLEKVEAAVELLDNSYQALLHKAFSGRTIAGSLQN